MVGGERQHERFFVVVGAASGKCRCLPILSVYALTSKMLAPPPGPISDGRRTLFCWALSRGKDPVDGPFFYEKAS